VRRRGFVTVALMTLIAVHGCTRRDSDITPARERQLLAEIDSLRQYAMAGRSTRSLRDSLRAAIDSYRIDAACGLAEYDIAELKEKGLADPASDIYRSLERQTNVVPFNVPRKPWVWRPVRERTFVLSPSWVYAEYSDGHSQGEALLEFTVAAPDSIRWKCVKAEYR
jgi:hypothetical protein